MLCPPFALFSIFLLSREPIPKRRMDEYWFCCFCMKTYRTVFFFFVIQPFIYASPFFLLFFQSFPLLFFLIFASNPGVLAPVFFRLPPRTSC